MTLPTQEERDEIYEQAHLAYYLYSRSGIRGQAITEKDGIEYWVLLKTIEFIENNRC